MSSPLRLYGRDDELATLGNLLALLRRGDGGALVLAAPPGLGRTALLRAAAETHRDRGPVLYATAAPAERAVPCSGLGTLLGVGPAGSSPAAPPAGITPDALAGRLREFADGGPLLVCVDDAHAWDASSRAALAFVARGPGAGSRIAFLLSAADGTAFAGLPTLHLAPLDGAAASALLDRLTAGTDGLDPVVRAELLREAGGNPRLLAGLTGRLTPDQLAGRTPLPWPLPGGEAVLAAHAERLDDLPDRTRTLLLLAAAAQEHEPEGAGADALLLLRAGTRAGLPRLLLDRALFDGAGTGGLLQRVGSRVHFAHRLTARAVLHHAPWARRRAAHELLATLLAEIGDRGGPDDAPAREAPGLPDAPEPRTAHTAAAPSALHLAALVQRACAAPGPDAALAAGLEAAAIAPVQHAARSAALARAALLSPGPALRAVRFAAAAEQARLAGDPALARALLARTGPRTADADLAAGRGAGGGATEPGEADPPAGLAPVGAGTGIGLAPGLAPYVHGMLALRSGPVADAHEVLLAAAPLLAPHDPRRAIEALLAAAEAAWAAGDALGYLDAMNRLARSPADEGVEHYRAGMSAVLEGRTAEGHARLRRCLAPGGDPGDPAALLRACVVALVLGDVAAACRAGARALAAVRTKGPDALLPQALEHLAYAELRAGRHTGARAHALEGLHAARRTGQPNSSAHLHAVLALAASVEGPAEACAAHGDAALAGAGPHGLAQAATLATWARARADLAAGRPGEAAARLAPLIKAGPGRGHFATRTLAVPCWVEAAVLGGRSPEETRELHAAVDEFAAWAVRTADPGAPAQLARCRALLAPADEADARYAEALAHHERAGGEFEQARTRLLYGQWLRRRRRTREARDPLRDALVGFQRCSARAWADRAAGELRAAGEPAGERPDSAGDPLAALTPQQQRIARCVAEGATNREVALRLSLSPRTVDHHLRNVFAALGIRSRTELARLLRP
ncbi:LuxR family transcriptional regulator [Streptomyces sp. SH5]|uniref:helix-turn-helix transcriptional regulator n=1 Tax=Streptomyces sp. SH5 TaxID=3041765 RepID=UPI0024782520|nr:LuxR family transcriptional regulator [Streptomyces sp. SH5]WGP09543.1 LuxR C-terminal-related transcriptional regulator [Streptomyces sp. SH5]